MYHVIFSLLYLSLNFNNVLLVEPQNQRFFLPIINAPVYGVDLGQDLSYSWQVDYKDEEIIAEVVYEVSDQDKAKGNQNPILKISLSFSKEHLFVTDWIAIGFSDYGEPDTLDLCVLWSDWKGNFFLEVDLQNDTLMPNNFFYQYLSFLGYPFQRK